MLKTFSRLTTPQMEGDRDMSTHYVALDGFEVAQVTCRAIGVSRGLGKTLTWIPRSQVEHGDEITKGETDIRVARWFVEREDLIT